MNYSEIIHAMQSIRNDHDLTFVQRNALAWAAAKLFHQQVQKDRNG